MALLLSMLTVQYQHKFLGNGEAGDRLVLVVVLRDTWELDVRRVLHLEDDLLIGGGDQVTLTSKVVKGHSIRVGIQHGDGRFALR